MAAIQVWHRPQAVSFETKDGYRKRGVARADHPELDTRFREMTECRPDNVGHCRISTKNGDFRPPAAEQRAGRVQRRFQGKPRRGIESGPPGSLSEYDYQIPRTDRFRAERNRPWRKRFVAPYNPGTGLRDPTPKIRPEKKISGRNSRPAASRAGLPGIRGHPARA